MLSPIYWIACEGPGRIAIAARPRAGEWLDGEIAAWRAAGIDVAVSLLEPSESTELGLKNEAALCIDAGIAFMSFPVADRGVPDSPIATARFARAIASRIRSGQHVLIHCRVGIGRSALLAACVLISCGVETGEAFAKIAAARGTTVPDTDGQRAWVAALVSHLWKIT